jgi:hypothetical protein
VWSKEWASGTNPLKPLPEPIVPWTPEEARLRYLMRHYELSGDNRFYDVY